MRLVAIEGSAPREHALFGGVTRIGSAAENDIVIADASVSRSHAKIHHRRGTYQIQDLGSTNGTYVNGRKIAKHTLVSGDELRFGQVRFVVVDSTAARFRRRILFRTWIEIMVVLFAIGFGVTDYLLVTESPSVSPVSSTPVANSHPVKLPIAPDRIAAPVSKVVRISVRPPDAGPMPGWLARVNQYRAMVGVAPADENPALSAGDAAHARYLVTNYGSALAAGSPLGAEMHAENAGLPDYSSIGREAAEDSDIELWEGGRPDTYSGPKAIDGWMSIPFHRLPILSPRLRRAGYGQYCSADTCAAALNVLTDTEKLTPIPQVYKKPIEFPPNGAGIEMTKSTGEWPDPLTSCPGYALPTGLPITLQLGNWYWPKMTAFSFKRDGADAPACGFDANDYVNPQASVQLDGRNDLRDHGAMVLIPRDPLKPGSTYSVSITADEKTYSWSFKVVAK
ncbi:MAG: FHA domain-containing protein [Candidatus Binataceae bacterium]|nr:FHA domain-containing protein [Candidatus Binataceae bacterium]